MSNSRTPSSEPRTPNNTVPCSICQAETKSHRPNICASCVNELMKMSKDEVYAVTRKIKNTEVREMAVKHFGTRK